MSAIGKRCSPRVVRERNRLTWSNISKAAAIVSRRWRCWLASATVSGLHRPGAGGIIAPGACGCAMVDFLKQEEPQPDDDFFPYLRPADKPGLLGMLGPYEVHEVIGRGGMAVVFKAVDPALHRVVAIKVMPACVASTRPAPTTFHARAQAAAAVCHDHVVTVHGVLEAAGMPCLVMQFIDGESLQDRLDRCGPLDVEDIVRLGLQIAWGWPPPTRRGSFIATSSRPTLLLENGLSAHQDHRFRPGPHGRRCRLTQAGVMAGTPEYMAPEQADGEAFDHRADLFSLGSVLYAMCTGLPPFRGPTAVAVLRRVSDQVPMPIRDLSPEVPVWLEELVRRLMTKHPADRFQSAVEVANLLEGYRAHLRQPTKVPAPIFQHAPPDPIPTPAKAGKRLTRRSWLLVFACLAAVETGLALWFAATAGPEGAPPQWKTRFYQDLRAADKKHPHLKAIGEIPLVYDAEGVRVSVPTGTKTPPTVGLATKDWQIHGDFEITLGYEILKADRPHPPSYGAGVSIYAAINTDTQDSVSLARRVMTDGSVKFVSDRMSPKPGPEHKTAEKASIAKSGRLRIRRAGARILFLVAEGDRADFTTIAEEEFGTADIRWMQVGGDAGVSDTAVDFRLIDLTVTAEDLPGLPDGMKNSPAVVAGLVRPEPLARRMRATG